MLRKVLPPRWSEPERVGATYGEGERVGRDGFVHQRQAKGVTQQRVGKKGKTRVVFPSFFFYFLDK